MTPSPDFEVLVVDDDPDMLACVSDALRVSGLKVHEASSGRDALGMLNSHKISVIVTDLNMPGMSGYELIEFVNQRPDIRNMPIFVISGHLDKRGSERLHALGVTEILMKPFEFSHLKQAILARAPSQP